MAASVALVGVGPRAVAVAARLVADHGVLTPGQPLTVHLIDPVDVGAGRTWRRDQHPKLLNNTYCAETTVFADQTVPTTGPVDPGPSLAEWAELVRANPDDFEDWVVTEATRTAPWSFPSRRFQGRYFRWALDRVIARAPSMINFREHLGTVVRLGPPLSPSETDARQILTLSDGGTVEADMVVLTQGLLTSDHSPETVRLLDQAAGFGLTYLSPGMPTERDWDSVPSGDPVLVRGLGANFFDLLGLLFEGRGGRFRRDADGELRYQASGGEPHVIAGSRRGLPYRAKGFYASGLPELVELPRLSARREQELITEHGGRADLDYRADLSAEVAADFADVYAEVSAQDREDDQSLDWRRLVYPAEDRSFAGQQDWTAFLDGYLERELVRIRRPSADPEKAVHRAMETLRRRLSRLVLAQVFDPVSVVRDLKQTLLPQALVLASGPPPQRMEELAALRRAGLVELLGPGLRIDVTANGFHASTVIPGQQRTARVLAEARMSLGDLHTTDDPLITALLGTGQARFHRIADGHGGWIETTTLDVTGDHFLLIDAAGRPHPRRIVLGSPAGDVQWNSAIGAIPNTSDKFLVGAERAASYVLDVVAASRS